MIRRSFLKALAALMAAPGGPGAPQGRRVGGVDIPAGTAWRESVLGHWCLLGPRTRDGIAFEATVVAVATGSGGMFERAAWAMTHEARSEYGIESPRAWASATWADSERVGGRWCEVAVATVEWVVRYDRLA